MVLFLPILASFEDLTSADMRSLQDAASNPAAVAESSRMSSRHRIRYDRRHRRCASRRANSGRSKQRQ